MTSHWPEHYLKQGVKELILVAETIMRNTLTGDIAALENAIKAFRRATMGGKYGPGFSRENTSTILTVLQERLDGLKAMLSTQPGYT